MLEPLLALTLAMGGLVVDGGAPAKTAFDHELSLSCPRKKAKFPDGRPRYSQTDLALTSVSARFDARELLTFAEIKQGKKPPVVTRAMLDARVAAAQTEFAKVLRECQAEHDWTDEERAEVAESTVAAMGQARSTFALFSPPESLLYNQYTSHMTQPEFQALGDGKFAGSERHKAVIADLKASTWYKETRQQLNLDDPYYQGLIVDAYVSKLYVDVMRGRFKDSAKRRFGD